MVLWNNWSAFATLLRTIFWKSLFRKYIFRIWKVGFSRSALKTFSTRHVVVLRIHNVFVNVLIHCTNNKMKRSQNESWKASPSHNVNTVFGSLYIIWFLKILFSWGFLCSSPKKKKNSLSCACRPVYKIFCEIHSFFSRFLSLTSGFFADR